MSAQQQVARSQTVRCAIYTRKSSDEGLEQAFNSLDAQREACAAYILSQASEGWTALPDIYDDGGLSGGTLQRPALQRLLAEVAAGRVDIIVVYKVDRLTRSLFDFAKLVETLDKTGTSFVSVTQSFNTTTSMGRLTLNMLLSFAQFEREVTAERIRDKISASKARGMWMGGTPPLGYAPDGRSLVIVDEHANLVRRLFERYMDLGSVRLVEEELRQRRTTLPVRTRVSGTPFGGGPFSRGQIYKILSNPIYIGRIPHGKTSHAGLHPAIITSDVWDAVQAKLADNLQGSRTRVRAASPSLLAGKLVDDAGRPLISTHASKAAAGPSGTTRYRYYAGGEGSGIRLPALEIEAAVTDRIAAAFDDPFAIANCAGMTLTPTTVASLAQHAADAAALLRKRDRVTARALVGQVRVHQHRIEIDCAAAAIVAALGDSTPIKGPETVTLTKAVDAHPLGTSDTTGSR